MTLLADPAALTIDRNLYLPLHSKYSLSAPSIVLGKPPEGSVRLYVFLMDHQVHYSLSGGSVGCGRAMDTGAMWGNECGFEEDALLPTLPAKLSLPSGHSSLQPSMKQQEWVSKMDVLDLLNEKMGELLIQLDHSVTLFFGIA